MKEVHIIKSGSLRATIGPIGTIRRILSSRLFLNEKGYDVKLFSGNKMIDRFPTFTEKNDTTTKKRRLKLFLDNLAKKWFLLAVILIEYKWVTHKFFIKKYHKLNQPCDIAVFHAELECYYFLKKQTKRKKKTKTVLFFHNDGIPLQMYLIYYPCIANSWYYRVLMKRFEYTLRNVDGCAFICRVGMENIINRYSFVREKSYLIVNGITDLNESDLADATIIRTSADKTKLKLVTVGSVSIRKGQRYIIEAISKLPHNVRDRIHLHIVGDGPDCQYCKQKVESGGLNSLVTFWGGILNSEVYKVLAESDVFVLLSSNEGLPISIIEAMRGGLPIISTDVSGIPELVSYNNGVILDSSNRADSFYNLLINSSQFDWKTMGHNSRKAYEEWYTFDRMLNKYVSMLNSM